MTAKHLVALVTVALTMVAPTATATAAPPAAERNPTQLVTGLEGGSGSTVGPDGALYVTESAAGKVSRVDPKTGDVTTFARVCRRRSCIGFGGAMDVAFIGRTAYVLVTRGRPRRRRQRHRRHLPGGRPAQLHRRRGHRRVRLANPPSTPFVIPTGVQYALQTYRGGFLVTDGHHNRVLRVTLDGEVSELIAFGNIVPTGLAVRGNKVYMAEAGPVPHLPEDGKVVAFGPKSPTATEVASGRPLLVDVEFGRGHDALRPLAGRLRRRPRGFSGVAEHRQPGEGRTRTAASPSSRTAWTGRPRSSSSGTPPTSSPSAGRSGSSTALVSAPRHVALNEPPSTRSCGAAPPPFEPPRTVQSDLSDLVPGRLFRRVVTRPGMPVTARRPRSPPRGGGRPCRRRGPSGPPRRSSRRRRSRRSARAAPCRRFATVRCVLDRLRRRRGHAAPALTSAA